MVAPIASIRRHGLVDTSAGSTSGIHALEQQPSATFGSHVDRTAQDKHPPMASRLIQTTSNAYVSSGVTPGPGTPPRVGKPPLPDAKAIQNVNVPVTFVHKNNVMVAGRVTGIGAQAAVVVTDETPPSLDEPVVINLPLLVKGSYRTVYLSGKLLQIGTPTDEGMRFVLHVEKCEEGNHKGAFAAFLAATH